MSTVPRYDFVLFDADHTLFDFDRAEHRALRQTLEAFGYPFNEETQTCYQSINNDLWARLNRGEVEQSWLLVERFAAFLRAMGGDHDPAEMNRDYLARLAQGGDVFPGAEELCRALAPHCTLAIVTNGVASAQHGRFARSPLRDLFSHVFISEEVGYAKPDPRFFQAAVDQLGIRDTHRAVVVGDNLISDIGGGNAAGMDTIWYNPGRFPPWAPPVPTWEVADYPSIEAILLPEHAAWEGTASR